MLLGCIVLIGCLSIVQTGNTLLSNLTSARRLVFGQPTRISKYLRYTLYEPYQSLMSSYIVNFLPDDTYEIYLQSAEVSCKTLRSEYKLEVLASQVFNSLEDLWICFSADYVPMKCSQTWSVGDGCGTYLEVHRPLNETVEASIKIDEFESDTPINLPLLEICAGTYHMWLVSKAPVGKVLHKVTAFYIRYPSCT